MARNINGRRVMDSDDGYCVMRYTHGSEATPQWTNYTSLEDLQASLTFPIVGGGEPYPPPEKGWFDDPSIACVMTYHADDAGQHAIRVSVRQLESGEIHSKHHYLIHETVDTESHEPHTAHEGGDALLLLGLLFFGVPFPDNWVADERIQRYLGHLNAMVLGARQSYARNQ